MVMKNRPDSFILNQWWADGIPLSGASAASAAAVALPARITTVGGATPTFTGGAQHFVMTGASLVDATYIGDIKFGEALPAGTNVIGAVTFGVLPTGANIIGAVTFGALPAGDSNFGNVDIVTIGALEQTTPALAAASLDLPDTEYAYGLPANCRAVRFQCRTANDLRYAWATGKVATPVEPYFTLKSGDVYAKENLKLTAATLHMATAASNLYMEIETWA